MHLDELVGIVAESSTRRRAVQLRTNFAADPKDQGLLLGSLLSQKEVQVAPANRRDGSAAAAIIKVDRHDDY